MAGASEAGGGEADLVERVIHALMLPAVRIARVFGVELSRIKVLAEMAYFQELRGQGLKLREIAEVMGISSSKAALLSRQLKRNFAAPSGLALERRIEFALWAEPLSAAKLAQTMPEAAACEVAAALARLAEAGRVARAERTGGADLWSLRVDQDRRDWTRLLSRLDGLNDALSGVTGAIYGRFFGADRRAFARTLSFRVPSGAHAELERIYEETIFRAIVALDERAGLDEASAEAMTLSIFWAPQDAVAHGDGDNKGESDA